MTRTSTLLHNGCQSLFLNDICLQRCFSLVATTNRLGKRLGTHMSAHILSHFCKLSNVGWDVRARCGVLRDELIEKQHERGLLGLSKPRKLGGQNQSEVDDAEERV